MAKHRLRRPPLRQRIARRLTRRAAPVAAGLAFVLVAASGCAKMSEPFNDAPRSGAEHSGPADIITMPDGFSNLATKCGPGGMRYTVAFHLDSPYAAIAVTPDTSCPK